MLYRRYLPSVLSGFIISILIFCLLVYFQIGAPTETSRWMKEAYAIKSSMATSINQPKLVVVAGSNALFGVSCQKIQQEMGIPCVNGAAVAPLGLDYLFYRARSWLKPGDTVLLPLEYHLYQSLDKPSNILIDYVFARDKNYFDSLNITQKFRFLGGLSWMRLLRGIVAKFVPPKPLNYSYQSDTLNVFGDETNNKKSDISEDNLKELSLAQPMSYVKDQLELSHGTNQIEIFADWCKSNNVQIIAAWPSTIWFEDYQGSRQKIFFQSISSFYANIDVPILGNYDSFMYDKSMFFDSGYHLHDEGTNERTQQIINLIEPYIM